MLYMVIPIQKITVRESKYRIPVSLNEFIHPKVMIKAN